MCLFCLQSGFADNFSKDQRAWVKMYSTITILKFHSSGWRCTWGFIYFRAKANWMFTFVCIEQRQRSKIRFSSNIEEPLRISERRPTRKWRYLKLNIKVLSKCFSDPGFPVREETPAPEFGTKICPDFLLKNCMKIKEIGLRQGVPFLDPRWLIFNSRRCCPWLP